MFHNIFVMFPHLRLLRNFAPPFWCSRPSFQFALSKKALKAIYSSKYLEIIGSKLHNVKDDFFERRVLPMDPEVKSEVTKSLEILLDKVVSLNLQSPKASEKFPELPKLSLKDTLIELATLSLKVQDLNKLIENEHNGEKHSIGKLIEDIQRERQNFKKLKLEPKSKSESESKSESKSVSKPEGIEAADLKIMKFRFQRCLSSLPIAEKTLTENQKRQIVASVFQELQPKITVVEELLQYNPEVDPNFASQMMEAQTSEAYKKILKEVRQEMHSYFQGGVTIPADVFTQYRFKDSANKRLQDKLLKTVFCPTSIITKQVFYYLQSLTAQNLLFGEKGISKSYSIALNVLLRNNIVNYFMTSNDTKEMETITAKIGPGKKNKFIYVTLPKIQQKKYSEESKNKFMNEVKLSLEKQCENDLSEITQQWTHVDKVAKQLNFIEFQLRDIEANSQVSNIISDNRKNKKQQLETLKDIASFLEKIRLGKEKIQEQIELYQNMQATASDFFSKIQELLNELKGSKAHTFLQRIIANHRKDEKEKIVQEIAKKFRMLKNSNENYRKIELQISELIKNISSVEYQFKQLCSKLKSSYSSKGITDVRVVIDQINTMYSHVRKVNRIQQLYPENYETNETWKKEVAISNFIDEIRMQLVSLCDNFVIYNSSVNVEKEFMVENKKATKPIFYIPLIEREAIRSSLIKYSQNQLKFVRDFEILNYFEFELRRKLGSLKNVNEIMEEFSRKAYVLKEFLRNSITGNLSPLQIRLFLQSQQQQQIHNIIFGTVPEFAKWISSFVAKNNILNFINFLEKKEKETVKVNVQLLGSFVTNVGNQKQYPLEMTIDQYGDRKNQPTTKQNNFQEFLEQHIDKENFKVFFKRQEQKYFVRPKSYNLNQMVKIYKQLKKIKFKYISNEERDTILDETLQRIIQNGGIKGTYWEKLTLELIVKNKDRPQNLSINYVENKKQEVKSFAIEKVSAFPSYNTKNESLFQQHLLKMVEQFPKDTNTVLYVPVNKQFAHEVQQQPELLTRQEYKMYQAPTSAAIDFIILNRKKNGDQDQFEMCVFQMTVQKGGLSEKLFSSLQKIDKITNVKEFKQQRVSVSFHFLIDRDSSEYQNLNIHEPIEKVKAQCNIICIHYLIKSRKDNWSWNPKKYSQKLRTKIKEQLGIPDLNFKPQNFNNLSLHIGDVRSIQVTPSDSEFEIFSQMMMIGAHKKLVEMQRSRENNASNESTSERSQEDN